jgi:hypothetical protein
MRGLPRKCRSSKSDVIFDCSVMEIVFAALFVVPDTMKLRFIIAPWYFAGAIATELTQEGLKFNPFIQIVLLWIGPLIRDRSFFLS